MARAAWEVLLVIAMVACVPRYFERGPLRPADLWAPFPVRHVGVEWAGHAPVDVAYVDSGGEGSPVVFVHGLSSYLGFWEYQLPHFARAHRVLALDLPGYGASGRPDAPYDPAWFAGIVARWLDTLGVARAVVVGHSMGGQIAMRLALDHPEKVDRLVLAAPAGFERFSAGESRWMKGFWHERRALEAREEEVRANFETMVFNRRDAGVERLLEERVRLGQSPQFRGTSVAVSRSIAGMVDDPLLGPPGDPGRLAEIRVPVLVVFGEDDRMIPNPVFSGGRTRRVAAEGTAAIPGARLALIPGAGHAVHHDAAEAFNAEVDRFLEAP